MAGAELAEELRLALAARLPIVMLHENDEAAGGCSRFDPIYNSTPAELKDAGLYDAIAVAWYPGKFRPVSVRLASAQLFGGGRAHGVGRGWGFAACPRRSLVVLLRSWCHMFGSSLSVAARFVFWRGRQVYSHRGFEPEELLAVDMMDSSFSIVSDDPSQQLPPSRLQASTTSINN